tara:strand:- start:609 stop:1715 length:1107 start_codon:yes stop_codon:yes gene_type:complete
MKTKKILVSTNQQKYPIFIGSGLISNLKKIIKNESINYMKCLIVVDKNISKKKINIIKKELNNQKVYIHHIKANEKNKNQKTTNEILEILLKKNFSREDIIISVGGGITGDITGYAASLFKRGLKFINIPTTLLAQVDSSIGGKTGVNTKYGKNLIGSFYQPKLVVSDIAFLNTLPKREIICGYGEILKHSLILNKNFFQFLNKNFEKILKFKSPYIEKTIYESCKIKKKVVEKDEKEKNIRKILNFGHTFAHAYEATLNFSNKLNHGEAVILGMTTALKFSQLNNFLSMNEFKIITSHIKNFNLPNDIKKYFSLKDAKKILSFMVNDKKNNTNEINLILLKKIGSPLIDKRFNKKKLKIFLNKELRN